MHYNSGAELVTGLSDLPLFAISLILLYVSAGNRKKGPVGRGWFMLCMTVSVTLIAGAVVHSVHMDERYLRIIWPLEYALITALTAMLWVQILRLFRPAAVSGRNIALIAVFGVIDSTVNGIVRFIYGSDLNPIFAAFAVPAVLHIIYSVLSCRDGRRNSLRTRFAVMALFLLLSIVVESAITEPVIIFGLPCKGAVFSHALIAAAMLMAAGMIRRTAEDTDAYT